MPDKIPLGQPLPLSDDDLRELTTAEETQKAQADAEKLWRAAVKPEIADLLDAVELPE
jgi:hypothetical protein